MKTRPFAGAIALAAAAVLTGCGTPQAALDQANATAALAAGFDSAWTDYRREAARVAAARLASLRAQQAQVIRNAEVDDWNARTAAFAGRDTARAGIDALRELVGARAEAAAAAAAAQAELDARLAAVVAPLPSGTASLVSVQRTLAALGTELSARERLALTMEAVQHVAGEVKKNREAAAGAAAAAASAAASAPAAPEGGTP
jgi:hypothetical protein